ncbi:MAG TPA: DUF3014 domain-containing protein [Vicinamibacterales bacterium]|nr:DUF3014 domain-containing protein [Vicinamibacterales bacterium]
MADLDDLPLDKPREPEPAPRGLRWRAALIAALVIVLALIVWNFFAPFSRPDSDVQLPVASAPERTGDRPLPVEGEAIDLAPLGETDPLVRQLVGQLSSHPKVAAWLATDQLIRNFTVVVVNIANGSTPARHLGSVRPAGEFTVDNARGDIIIHPRSYRRYDEYADAIAGLDPVGTARLYATLKPRIQEAAAELGYPDDFTRTMERAFVELLKTPVVEGQVGLTPKSVAYDFADPKLRSLSAAQRQFLRMGPRNMRMVQTKLREIAQHIGIAPEALPR